MSFEKVWHNPGNQKATHMHRAVLKNRKNLRPLVYLEALHKEEVKFKPGMLNDWQNVDGVPQHAHSAPQQKPEDLLITWPQS